MTAECRDMLDQIDLFLCRDDRASKELAAVLTALRGPDSGAIAQKLSTTVPIRRAAFPKRALQGAPMVGTNIGSEQVYSRGMMITGGKFVKPLLPLDRYNADSAISKYHFEEHIILAASALGLLKVETEPTEPMEP
jgi:hypothetical protein